jgi:cation:H+ antiporter
MDTKLDYEEHSTAKVYAYFSIASVFIIAAGIWLAIVGDEIATVTGWEASFVGSLFLAFTTSLPEITVSFSALRIGADDMAMANMIGSNLFNLTVIPIADLIYGRGPILASISINHIITASAVILMTLLFIIGLHYKPLRFFRISWYNGITIALFLIAAFLNFNIN